MRYHNITKEDMLNGNGLRVVLWVAGCSHACAECQNPVTWDIHGGIPFDENAKKELFLELDKDYIDGITFSCGDPLHMQNREEITKLSNEIKEKYPFKTQCLYTEYEWKDVKDLDIMKNLDVVIDGKFVIAQKDVKLKWKGSSNQNVIDVKKTRENQNDIVLYCN